MITVDDYLFYVDAALDSMIGIRLCPERTRLTQSSTTVSV
jgi:hypothetical protein